MKADKIKTRKGLERYLNTLIKGKVKYFTEGEDSIFTYNYRDVAKWDYNEQKAIIYDDIHHIHKGR